jgi:hypothetical protein
MQPQLLCNQTVKVSGPLNGGPGHRQVSVVAEQVPTSDAEILAGMLIQG